jgi:hypothetical protein
MRAPACVLNAKCYVTGAIWLRYRPLFHLTFPNLSINGFNVTYMFLFYIRFVIICPTGCLLRPDAPTWQTLMTVTPTDLTMD